MKRFWYAMGMVLIVVVVVCPPAVAYLWGLQVGRWYLFAVAIGEALACVSAIGLRVYCEITDRRSRPGEHKLGASRTQGGQHG